MGILKLKDFIVIIKDYAEYMASMVSGINKNCTGNHYKDAKTALSNILEQIEKESKYIGKDDIEKNKIYADNSIIEIDFVPYQDNQVKIYGYFSYVQERLRFEFFQYFEARKVFAPAYIDLTNDNRFGEVKIIGTVEKNEDLSESRYHEQIIFKIERLINA